MVKLSKTFSRFQPFSALVLGDFMLDTYTTGRVTRISPEAPVPVMEVLRHEARPGGAGNVALNLATLGGKITVLGRMGDDREGSELSELLTLSGINCSALVVEKNYLTPVKNRLIADSQQLLRVDREKISSLSSDHEDQVIHRLSEIIPTVQVVALSDYGKGFLTNRVISETLHMAKRYQIPAIVDPKGADFAKYRGATIIKPNLSEAYAAAKMPLTAPLEDVAKSILSTAQSDLLLITRSEAGMSLFDRIGNRTDFPVRSREVKDVTGAGDTVLAMICLSLANGLDVNSAAQLANIAAGIAIERLGCAQITLSEIAERLLTIDRDTKIFDESHTYALHQVLQGQGRRYSLLVLEKEQEMSNALFRAIRTLSERKGHELILYVRDSNPHDEIIHLLSSLSEVDYIILQGESLKNLCGFIHPYEVCRLEGQNLVALDPAKILIEDLLAGDRQAKTFS